MPLLNEVSSLYDTPLDGRIAPTWTPYEILFHGTGFWIPGEARFEKMKRK